MFKAIKEFFVGKPKPVVEVPYKIDAPVLTPEPVAVQVAGLTVVEGAGIVDIPATTPAPAAKKAPAKKPAAAKKAPAKKAPAKSKKTTG